MKRPVPPSDIAQVPFHYDDMNHFLVNFLPAPELKEWIWETFIIKDAPLHNKEHEHLTYFDKDLFEVMWATTGFEKAEKTVVGQCEKVMINVGGWKKYRQELQMLQWFGRVPTYIITIDARYSQLCSDADFCALIEHELCHIGVKRDEDGEMLFSPTTGEPKLYLRGHDVEEFHTVVQRYGASESVQKMVDLANDGPTIRKANIAHACGTCLLKLA